MTTPGNSDPNRSALFTDLYELTMAQAYMKEAMDEEAVFELFFRELPPNRNYILACGLDDALSYLEQFRFDKEDLDYLRRQKTFTNDFLGRLARLRFTGDVFAVPEGTAVFPNEPVVQVLAPIIEAQIVETYILNQIHFQSVVATKAARVVSAAQGRSVVDFGSRRAHGTDAALKVARTSYIAGADGTSNVLGGRRYGIPVFGTIAHSYVQAHDDELEAFRRFSEQYPDTTMIVDTYDTIEGVKKVIALAEERGDLFDVRAVRLDSGDLSALAKQSRRLLDDAGLRNVKIFASSGLDENEIAGLIADGAPVDGFGVGTNLAVSNDAPALDFAYKLVAYAGRPRLKLSEHKELLPGRKQVFRAMSRGRFEGDVIGRYDEGLEGQPLLIPVLRAGKRLPGSKEDLNAIRKRVREQLESLPPAIRSIEKADRGYPVKLSRRLRAGASQPKARGRIA